MADKALILVDFENEWIDKRSAYFVGDILETIKRTNRVLDFCRRGGYRIIFTTHIEKGSDGAFAPGSRNVEIIDGLGRRSSDVLISKNKISPFYRTSLEERLKGVEGIVICGILTNLCVRSLAEEGYDRDFRIKILGDCCVALDKETQDFTLKDLKATREEIVILNAEEFISQG